MLVFFVRALVGVPVALRPLPQGVRATAVGYRVGQRLDRCRRRHRRRGAGARRQRRRPRGHRGQQFLSLLGLGPATGFISSLVNTREFAPIMASLAFAMQAGCRFTAQLGSMRIAEEIDAMDTLAIPAIPFLVTTRLMASVIAVIPLYLACLAITYLTTPDLAGIVSGGSTGPYLHYFTMMLAGKDIVYSVIKCVVFVWIASTLQCYYGFYARAAPTGVGVAAGHAMRAAITVVVITNMLLTMAMWSVDAGAKFGG